ncbi:MAG: hypothetical protein GKS06_03005 [Acidobacteria bacterium]|nr:hypothetical protein [Acidobacteriota bacterium]
MTTTIHRIRAAIHTGSRRKTMTVWRSLGGRWPLHVLNSSTAKGRRDATLLLSLTYESQPTPPEEIDIPVGRGEFWLPLNRGPHYRLPGTITVRLAPSAHKSARPSVVVICTERPDGEGHDLKISALPLDLKP